MSFLKITALFVLLACASASVIGGGIITDGVGLGHGLIGGHGLVSPGVVSVGVAPLGLGLGSRAVIAGPIDGHIGLGGLGLRKVW